jgi:RAB protein geranylgeranyltransferase component A
MNQESLSQIFDLIIIGTGGVESLIAAAAARKGKSVLHIDSSTHYGWVNSSISLKQLEELAFPLTVCSAPTIESNLLIGAAAVADIKHALNDGLLFFGEQHRLPDALRKISSRFSVDLVPSLVLSRGQSVDLILRSGAAVYAEFKNIETAWVVDSGPTTKERPSDLGSSSTWKFHKARLSATREPFCFCPYALLHKTCRCRPAKLMCLLRRAWDCWINAG